MHLEKYARADVIGYAHVLHAKRSGRARREEELFWRAVKLSPRDLPFWTQLKLHLATTATTVQRHCYSTPRLRDTWDTGTSPAQEPSRFTKSAAYRLQLGSCHNPHVRLGISARSVLSLMLYSTTVWADRSSECLVMAYCAIYVCMCYIYIYIYNVKVIQLLQKWLGKSNDLPFSSFIKLGLPTRQTAHFYQFMVTDCDSELQMTSSF